MPKIGFRRVNHRLRPEEYRGQKWFFVTMCCRNRKPVFADPNCVTWVLEVLRAESIVHNFLIDAYCVMPDHLHLLALGTSATSHLLKFIRGFKQKTTFRYLETNGTVLWQDNFYDHILRSHESPQPIAAYIWLNPVRKGLCKEFQEYPHSGSFSRPWKASIAASWTPPWKRARMPA